MECKDLRGIVRLIKAHPDFNTNAKIASWVGISESTLRGYCDKGKTEEKPPQIPDKNVGAFCKLLRTVAQQPLTLRSARRLLQGSADRVREALRPIEGGLWRKLCEEFQAHTQLEVKIKPTPHLGFGELDEEDSTIHDRIVPFRQSFYFIGKSPWCGEAALFAEHLGEWRICLLAKERPFAQLKENEFSMPPQPGPALIERGKPGLYRYFVIGVKHRMPADLKKALRTTNPVDHSRLDTLADYFMNEGVERCRVWATTIRIKRLK